MKILSLVRHTPPAIAPGICYGRLEVELGSDFARDALAVKDWLQAADKIVSSPATRTLRLAHFLARELSCECSEDTRLLEMDFGAWEGRAWNDIARAELDAWSADVLHYTPPAGESAAHMMQRVQLALDAVMAMPQRHIVLVAHGGTLRAILALLGGIELQQTLGWQIEFGAVLQIKLDV